MPKRSWAALSRDSVMSTCLPVSPAACVSVGDVFSLQELSRFTSAYRESDGRGRLPLHAAAVQPRQDVLHVVLQGETRHPASANRLNNLQRARSKTECLCSLLYSYLWPCACVLRQRWRAQIWPWRSRRRMETRVWLWRSSSACWTTWICCWSTERRRTTPTARTSHRCWSVASTHLNDVHAQCNMSSAICNLSPRLIKHLDVSQFQVKTSYYCYHHHHIIMKIFY